MKIETPYILTFILCSQMWLVATHFVEGINKIFTIGIGMFWLGGAMLVFNIGIKTDLLKFKKG